MDLDTLLRDSALVAEPTTHDLVLGRTALDAATAVHTNRVTAARRTSRNRSRRLGLTSLVAAAASLVLVVGPTLNVGSTRPTANADAAQVLLNAGTAAGAQPGGWPDAAYWHSVSTYRRGTGPAEQREIWIGHHAPGVLKDGGVEAGILPLGVAIFPTGGSDVTWDQLYALPTDPDTLERRLRSGINGAGNGDDAEMYVIVGDLLRESPAPPALRKALWQVAARIPGVTLVGAVTDGAGRPGVAVERDYQRYVFDPDNGRVLEESQNSAPAPGTPDDRSWRTTYLQQGPSDTAPAATAH